MVIQNVHCNCTRIIRTGPAAAYFSRHGRDQKKKSGPVCQYLRGGLRMRTDLRAQRIGC